MLVAENNWRIIVVILVQTGAANRRHRIRGFALCSPNNLSNCGDFLGGDNGGIVVLLFALCSPNNLNHFGDLFGGDNGGIVVRLVPTGCGCRSGVTGMCHVGK